MIHWLWLVLVLLVCVFIYSNEPTPTKLETFQVQFGTHSTTDAVTEEHTKALLEIGTQSIQDTKFDVVSTEKLGEREPVPTQIITLPPPDPICFVGDEDKGGDIMVPISQRTCCGGTNSL